MRIMMGGESISLLLNLLRGEFDGPVADRTGLSRRFDIDAEYESTAMERTGQASVRPSASAAPVLRDALTTQLGLKLEQANALDVASKARTLSPD